MSGREDFRQAAAWNALPPGLRRWARTQAQPVVVRAIRRVDRRRVPCVAAVIVRQPDHGGSRLVLLARHTSASGAAKEWSLPGGLSRRGEPPQAAVRRKIRQRLGIDVASWRHIPRADDQPSWTFPGEADGVIRVLDCFWGIAPPDQEGPMADGVIYAELRWFPIDDPPRRLAGRAAEILARGRELYDGA
jgi:ADP-ribose pyrophosphatase YjhB (NUDIX family)